MNMTDVLADVLSGILDKPWSGYRAAEARKELQSFFWIEVEQDLLIKVVNVFDLTTPWSRTPKFLLLVSLFLNGA